MCKCRKSPVALLTGIVCAWSPTEWEWSVKTQVLIIGGGPAGSACAIHLARIGIESVIIERETFPRFHIGESLTGDSGDLLREIGLENTMASMNFPIKYGIRGHGPAGFTPFWVPIKTRDLVTHEQLDSHS